MSEHRLESRTILAKCMSTAEDEAQPEVSTAVWHEDLLSKRSFWSGALGDLIVLDVLPEIA